jgi:hypothetical protein
MGKARQVRRVGRRWAEQLGAAAGIEAVDDFANGGPCGDDPPTAAELRATLKGSWDGPAINAGAARIDGCPSGHFRVYYEAYERAARDRVEELAAELEAVAA